MNTVSDARKYNAFVSVDGKKPEPGYVLVPWWLKEDEEVRCVKKNLFTWERGGFDFNICYIQVPEESYASYMKEFNREINEYIKPKRSGRCIIGKKPNGKDILCPYSNRCTNCPNKGLFERSNPQRVELLSLINLYNESGYEPQNTTFPDPEDEVLEELCPEPSQEELLEMLLAYLEGINPRFAKIVRYKLEGKDVREIGELIGLRTSRLYQEIQKAHDAACDYLKLPQHKKKKEAAKLLPSAG